MRKMYWNIIYKVLIKIKKMIKQMKLYNKYRKKRNIKKINNHRMVLIINKIANNRSNKQKRQRNKIQTKFKSKVNRILLRINQYKYSKYNLNTSFIEIINRNLLS